MRQTRIEVRREEEGALNEGRPPVARKRITPAGIAVRLVIVVALAVAIYYVWQWRTTGHVARLEKIEVGDSRERVLEVMGPPDDEMATFPLPAETKFADEAARADAETWLFWSDILGVKCVVGLAADGTVVYTAHTGT
jgi:hypothetical protein